MSVLNSSENIPKSPLEEIKDREIRLGIEKTLAIRKAMESNDVNEILKAQAFIKDLKPREETEVKSLLLDPQQLSTGFGWKSRPHSLSHEVLRNMGKTHIIKAITETRKEQISAFCTPQTDKYAPGFVVEKRSKFSLKKEEKKLTKADEQRIEDIIEFLLNCGNTNNQWHADTFKTFVSKIAMDSLILDQATAEIIRNRGGQLCEFLATDGGTYRVADSYDENEMQKKEVMIKGYAPSHVQIYQHKIIAEFYPWELMFGVRNPNTDIRCNGYGKSELEDMIQTVTALLNSDYYNANFFKVGSAPKGILRYSGNINQNTVEDFKRQWIAQVAGVQNMHKIPLINADKLDFINTQQNNKDMEFSKYQEFLIKISCAMYKMDPSEIGFPMSGSADSKPMFEGNNDEKLKYSRDKGLKPLLKHIEQWLNKWIVWQLDDTYEFRFVGIDLDNDEETDLDQDIKRLSNFMTLNEIRAKWNLKPIKGGDTILNPTFQQAINQAMQGNPDANAAVNNNGGGGDNQDDKGDSPFDSPDDATDPEKNPFLKSLYQDLPRIFAPQV